MHYVENGQTYFKEHFWEHINRTFRLKDKNFSEILVALYPGLIAPVNYKRSLSNEVSFTTSKVDLFDKDVILSTKRTEEKILKLTNDWLV